MNEVPEGDSPNVALPGAVESSNGEVGSDGENLSRPANKSGDAVETLRLLGAGSTYKSVKE